MYELRTGKNRPISVLMVGQFVSGCTLNSLPTGTSVFLRFTPAPTGTVVTRLKPHPLTCGFVFPREHRLGIDFCWFGRRMVRFLFLLTGFRLFRAVGHDDRIEWFVLQGRVELQLRLIRENFIHRTMGQRDPIALFAEVQLDNVLESVWVREFENPADQSDGLIVREMPSISEVPGNDFPRTAAAALEVLVVVELHRQQLDVGQMVGNRFVPTSEVGDVPRTRWFAEDVARPIEAKSTGCSAVVTDQERKTTQRRGQLQAGAGFVGKDQALRR